MVSKEEFIAMVSKLWDMHSGEMKIKGGKMTLDQVKELEKILGRSLGGN
jgi:ABC-type enterochelin transport system ATPase subunit